MALKVEVVSRERVVWTGEAKYVRARSVSGDLGILPGMIPTCTLLAQDGELLIEPVDGEPIKTCLLYTSPSPRDVEESRMPSSA